MPMERRRKRVRVERATAAQWTFHADQRLVGVGAEPGAVALVAAGERHVQIRAANASAVGKLVALEGSRAVLQRPQDGTARFYAALPCPKTLDPENRMSLCVLDSVQMQLDEVPFPNEIGPIDRAFLDGETGDAIVLVERSGGESPRLWCWTRSHDWTARDMGIASAHWAWNARFFTSPVFGRCVHIVGVWTVPDDAQLTIESRLFAVDNDWTLLHSFKRRIQGDKATRVWLSPSSQWLVLVNADGRRLSCVPLDPYGAQMASSIPPSHSKNFEVAVADIAWCDDVVAVLLVDGSVRMMELPVSRNQALMELDVIDGERTHPQLSFQTRGETEASTTTTWHTLVWISTNGWLVASRGANTSMIVVAVEDTGASPLEAIHPAAKITGATANERSSNMRRRRRRLHSGLDARQSHTNDISAFSTADNSGIIQSVRTVLAQHDALAADTIFTLLAILLQRVLRRLGFMAADHSPRFTTYEDVPIQVGIMEMLLAQIVTTRYPLVRATAAKIVQAPAFCSRNERQSYYQDEAHSIASPNVSTDSFLAHRRYLIRCIQEVLAHTSQFLELAKPSDVEALTRSTASSGVIEGTQVLTDTEQEVDSSNRSNPLLRVRALISVFTLISDACESNRLKMDVTTLLQSLVDCKRPSQVTERYIERFVTTAPLFPLVVGHSDAQSRQIDVLRRLIVRSGLETTIIRYCAASADARLFELLHSTKRRKEDKWISRAISQEVIRQAIVQFESLVRSAPLLIRSTASERRLGNTSSPRWVRIVEEEDAAVDGFVKLVFVTTDTMPLSDDIVLTYINSSAVLNPDEVNLRTQVFKLLWIVMHHIRQQASLSLETNWSEWVLRLHAQVFLFDQLWSINTASSVLQFVNEAIFASKAQATIQGRVPGLRLAEGGLATSHTQPLSIDDHRRTLRTVALLLWSLWVRERSSLCKEAIDEYRQNPSDGYEGAAQKLGSMAASCALHLKAIALFRDPQEEDELVALQLSFLEASAELNPSVTRHVLQWAFAPDAMNARNMRRLRGVYAIAGMASPYGDKTDVDSQRREIRRVALLGSTVEDNEQSSNELDAFGTCCCDAKFQRVVWALLQRRFSVVSTAAPSEQRIPIKKALQARPSSVDGLISRHEVVSLLQAHRHEIEDQMQRLRQVEEKTLKEISTKAETTTIAETVKPERKTASEIISAIESLHDVKPQDNKKANSSDSSGSRRASGTLRKGSSTQNVLKLLQLRKENHEVKRHQSTPQMVGIPLHSAIKNPISPSPNPATVSPESRENRDRQQERVLPLRRDHLEMAELLLLTTAEEKAKRSVPLSRKSFRLAIPSTKLPIVQHEEGPSDYSSCAVQCTETRTTSMQTDEMEPVRPSSDSNALPQEGTKTEALKMPEHEVQSVSVGTQSQAQEHSPEGSRNPSVSPIGSRFPVYVDLENSSAQKFLHVARIKIEDKSSPRERDSIRIVTPATGSELESVGSEPMPLASGPTEVDAPRETITELTNVQIQERRRQMYRAHFLPAKNRLSASNRSQSAGVESFVSLKSEMERMKAKLAELEKSARDLDDDFQSSQHKLENLSKPRRDESRAVLNDIDNVIDATDTSDRGGHSTLSTKAARDLDSARHLLDQIESLTRTEQGST